MKKMLFVGASGAVAAKILPGLKAEYDIVGISRQNKDLAPFCREHITGDLLRTGPSILENAFKRHIYDVVFWNAVAYFPHPILETTREELHTEFDLAVALPLLCVSLYSNAPEPQEKRFIAVSSQLAHGHLPPWSSYSIVKNATVELMKHVAKESSVRCITLEPARIAHISEERMCACVKDALTTPLSGHIVRIDEDL